MAAQHPFPTELADLPETLPLFPLPGALLLPRGQMPLNIFEPRYLAMIDSALSTARLIGMIQPDPAILRPGPPALYPIGCVGRITQFVETGDGRYLIHLTGVARFRLLEEFATPAPFREARVDFAPYGADLVPRQGEEAVDRASLIATLEAFISANRLDVDWESIHTAPAEALVNALAMMSPYGVPEKQALLEAKDLKSRAEMLIAITEIELARRAGDGETRVQ